MRLALIGYGRMGRAVEETARARNHDIVCRIDPAIAGLGEDNQPLESADVAVVFTTPDAVLESARMVTAAGVDLVVGSTGWSDELPEVEALVTDAGVGLIHSPNFSLGVHVFLRLARAAGRMVDEIEDYDIQVRETHHRHKVDHPSGTAIAIADSLVEELARKRDWQEGPPRGASDPGVLYVTSTRTGEIAGIHEVGLEGPDDSIELRHVARSRGAFAKGAVAAAEWIRGRKGVFTMDDMMDGGSER